MFITRRHFFFGSLAVPALAADKPAERPNVVLILADNLPAWALGCYGNREIRTPNLDRLAQMGTRFHRHSATAPVPGTGRATLLTGRTAMQLRHAEEVPPGETGLEKTLSAAGYACSTSDPAGAVKLLDSATAGKRFLLTVDCGGMRAPYEDVPQKYRDLYAKTPFNTFAPDPAASNARSGKEMLGDIVGSLRKYAAAVSAVDEQVQSVVAKIWERKLQDSTAVVFTSTCGALLGHHGLWGAGDASEPPTCTRNRWRRR
jgi:arylsulfatase A-like enzyme